MPANRIVTVSGVPSRWGTDVFLSFLQACHVPKPSHVTRAQISRATGDVSFVVAFSSELEALNLAQTQLKIILSSGKNHAMRRHHHAHDVKFGRQGVISSVRGLLSFSMGLPYLTADAPPFGFGVTPVVILWKDAVYEAPGAKTTGLLRVSAMRVSPNMRVFDYRGGEADQPVVGASISLVASETCQRGGIFSITLDHSCAAKDLGVPISGRAGFRHPFLMIHQAELGYRFWPPPRTAREQVFLFHLLLSRLQEICDDCSR